MNPNQDPKDLTTMLSALAHVRVCRAVSLNDFFAWWMRPTILQLLDMGFLRWRNFRLTITDEGREFADNHKPLTKKETARRAREAKGRAKQ